MVMLQTPVWLNAVIFSTFTILVFVPIRYAYPSRNPVGRMPMFVLGGLWSVLMLWLIVALPDPPRAWVWLSLFFPAYYMIFSVYLDFSERRARTKPAQR
jgi:phosphatidylcholine synthase